MKPTASRSNGRVDHRDHEEEKDHRPEITITANNLQEEMKKIEVDTVKPPSSPTSFLAKSSVLLPTGVARVKQTANMQSGSIELAPKATSGSATGKNNDEVLHNLTMPRCCGVSPINVIDGDGSPRSLGLRIQDGNPRNKTALAPGHSLMDWIRLGSSGVDLTGVGGINQVVTLTELAKHNQRNDAWIAIRGIVFNVTRYMDFHPGGVPELMKGVGKDATKLFDDVHAWVNYQSILQKCVVGRLSRSGNFETAVNPFVNEKSSSKLLVPATVVGSSTKEKKSTTSASKIQSDWKQTTNTLTFIYKTTQDQFSPTFRLIHKDKKEFVIKIHLSMGATVHEYEVNEDVEWPPTCLKNSETGEVEFCFTKVNRKLWSFYGSRTVGIEREIAERIYRDWQVVSNTSLCESLNLLVLRTKDYMEILPVGRHVEAKMNIMGMEVSRPYTPLPPSLHPDYEAPGYKSDCLCLIVKRYDDGALSPSITSLQPGQCLTLSNGLGTFMIEAFDKYNNICMLAAGTGLTPMLGIINRALCRRNVTSINLVNFNKTEKSIFCREQLDRVCTDSKLKVVHVLSQPEESWIGKKGIVCESLLEEIIGRVEKQTCIFICGPEGFISTTREALVKLGWNDLQTHAFHG